MLGQRTALLLSYVPCFPVLWVAQAPVFLISESPEYLSDKFVTIFLHRSFPLSPSRSSPDNHAHKENTCVMKAQTRTSHGMAWTRILFLSVGMDAMMKVSCFASRGSGYWAEVGRLIKPSFHNWISLFLYCFALVKLGGTPWEFVWLEFVSAVLVRTFFHCWPCCLRLGSYAALPTTLWV